MKSNMNFFDIFSSEISFVIYALSPNCLSIYVKLSSKTKESLLRLTDLLADIGAEVAAPPDAKEGLLSTPGKSLHTPLSSGSQFGLKKCLS